VLSPSLLGSLVLALSIAAVATADAAPNPKRQCLKSCKTLQKNCKAFAKAERTVAQGECPTERSERRICRKTAKQTFKASVRECRAARKACRPCCDLGGPNECARTHGVQLTAEPQEVGDAANGRALLLAGDFMTCGVPYKLWAQGGAFPDVIAAGFGGTADAPRLPERTGNNADLPYFLNAFSAPDGAEVINGNCLMCHGGTFDGELVIGLGNATADFTNGAGGGPTNVPLTDPILDALGFDDAEKSQIRTLVARAAILGPQTRMRTVGQNPAEILAIILIAHRDRDTLAWSDTPVIPVDFVDAGGMPLPDPAPALTSDPPPWWRVHKKNALFYNGMARGDHRATMALATSVCVDSTERAAEVDAMFRDIQAFVKSVRAPAYARTVDDTLAATGRTIFERDCGICHGTYAEQDADETYPNLLIPLAVVGTDPVVAEAGVVHAPEIFDWYNQTPYGDVTRMVPNDPFPGYMPPPLDGIWATAPFLHNGSVPTVALLLNSRARPTYWRRVDLDSTNFDEEALGWPWLATDAPSTLPEDERTFVYDTTVWSQSNAGHPFGDHLTDEERRAVIEYLKTL
jgi:mono/diheme cytochrome c family protein